MTRDTPAMLALWLVLAASLFGQTTQGTSMVASPYQQANGLVYPPDAFAVRVHR